MDLRDYLRILRRRWVLITACTLAGLAVAAGLTFTATKQYTSTARMAAVSAGAQTTAEGYQGGLLATQRVATYADIATGGELSQRVIDSLGLNLTAGQLASKIQSAVVPDTVLLTISVTDPDPAMAQKIARSVVKELTNMVEQLETPRGETRPLVNTQVIDPATLPETPSSPRPLRNLLLGGILGLLLGLGLAVLRELLDTSVKTSEEIEELADAPVLGGIALDPEAAKTPLVSGLPPHSPRVESFRVLRTNLQFVDIDSRNKVYVVSSSVPGEGKSTTSVNVAITMSQAGQRVLLIDCDLRRPQAANMLGLENVVGVTTVLLGKVGLAEAIQQHAASGLDVLCSGATPPNPAELLQSKAMADLLVDARADYDVVVIDSPPLLPVTDAALLAAQVDGCVLVCRYGKTTRDQLAGACQRLDSVGGRVLGVVLNRLPAKGGDSGYGYGYGYGYGPDEADRGGSRRKAPRQRRDDPDAKPAPPATRRASTPPRSASTDGTQRTRTGADTTVATEWTIPDLDAFTAPRPAPIQPPPAAPDAAEHLVAEPDAPRRPSAPGGMPPQPADSAGWQKRIYPGWRDDNDEDPAPRWRPRS